MSIELTLKNVEMDIKQGDFGKARDRMHGLIANYPNNLSIRRQLGDIYWKLQVPSMAGRYWYLEKDKSAEMESACRKFENQCGSDPMQILLALKYRGDFPAIENEYAGRILLELHEQAKRKHKYYTDFRNWKGKTSSYHQRDAKKTNTTTILACCLIALLIGLVLMTIGVFTVIGWTIR